jgi:hypothetical protein
MSMTGGRSSDNVSEAMSGSARPNRNPEERTGELRDALIRAGPSQVTSQQLEVPS